MVGFESVGPGVLSLFQLCRGAVCGMSILCDRFLLYKCYGIDDIGALNGHEL
jgi:hypothetical protein